MKKYISIFIVTIVFSGSALAEETKAECVERVVKECTANHGSDLLEFNPNYHNCLMENLPLCPGFGK